MRFEPIEGWGTLPDRWRYVECAGVVVDKKDDVFVFTSTQAMDNRRVRPYTPTR